MEVSIFQKAEGRLVVIHNTVVWKHAIDLLKKKEAELHVKLFDALHVGAKNMHVEGSSESSIDRKPANKRLKSHHQSHSTETMANISLWKRVRIGTYFTRTKEEQSLFVAFKKDIAALSSSMAENEALVVCGLCRKKIQLNKVRARGYFVKKKFRKCDDNHTKLLKEPVAVCSSNEPSVFFIADRSGCVYCTRLHYPAEVKLIAKGLSSPLDLTEIFGVLIVCESGKKRIAYIDHKKTLKQEISKANKTSLLEICTLLNIQPPEKSTVKNLRQRLTEVMDIDGPVRTEKEPAIKEFRVNGSNDMNPTAIYKVNEDLPFVADIQTKSIMQLSVKKEPTRKGFELVGSVLNSFKIENMGGCFGMSLLDGNLYASDHVAGILRMNLDSGVTISITDNSTQNYCPHGIAIVQNEIFVSDVLHKKLYRVAINGDDDFSRISVVVGSGQDGNEDGIGTFCEFSQPTGLCSEGSTLILVDSGAKNIRIVTSVLPLVKYLSKLGQLYKTFSVHESILGKNPRTDITTCASTLNDILHFLNL